MQTHPTKPSRQTSAALRQRASSGWAAREIMTLRIAVDRQAKEIVKLNAQVLRLRGTLYRRSERQRAGL